jgi:hypothetical protein
LDSLFVGREVKMKRLIFLILLIMLIVVGCPQQSEQMPAEPITVHLSFPDGAPPLNQEAKLVCTVKTPARSAKNMSVSINLPEALELVSGDLSWSGDIAQGSEVEIIRAVVGSVKAGNWTIEATTYIDPEKHGGYGGTGKYNIYVSVFESSAEWGIYPPWYRNDFGC